MRTWMNLEDIMSWEKSRLVIKYCMSHCMWNPKQSWSYKSWEENGGHQRLEKDKKTMSKNLGKVITAKEAQEAPAWAQNAHA